MCYLFKFSKFILVPVLLDWLEGETLVLLDSAMCNTKLRQRLIELIVEFNSKFRAVLIPSMAVPVSIELLDWFDRRGLGKFELVKIRNSLLQELQTVWQDRTSHPLTRLSLNRLLQSSKTTADKKQKMVQILPFLLAVKHIELSYFSPLKASTLPDLLKYCENLESVTLSGVESNLVVKALKNNSVKLKQLKISQGSVKEKTLMMVCRRSPGLQMLSLSQSLQLSSESMHQILVNNRAITSLGVDAVSNRSLQQLSLHCSSTPLVELVCHQVSDVTLRSLVWFRGSIHLRRLDLSFSPAVNDFTLSEVGSACPSLLEIRLKNCHHITTAGVHALCSQTPLLQLLDLRNVNLLTNEGVASVVLQCKNLHTLLLYSQEHITKVGLQYIGTYAPQLTHLSLCNMQLTDESLVHIVHRCSLLRDVELGINGRVTDQAFMKLAAVCGAQLRRLDLTCCDRLTELTLFALAEHCSRLTDLNVSICNLVSDKGVSAVVRQCKALRALSIYYCKCVSDASMGDVAEFGSRLTELNIGHTAVSSAATVERIIRDCRRLKELKLTHPDQDQLSNFAGSVNPNLKLQFL